MKTDEFNPAWTGARACLFDQQFQMSASFIHWWRWLPCKVPTSTSGAVWGSVSCPWMLWHADQGNQTSDLQITRIWLYPWARAASRWRHQVEKLSNFQDHRGGTLECRVWLHLTVLFWFISLPKDTKKKFLIGLSHDPSPASVSYSHCTVHHSCKWRGCGRWDSTTLKAQSS